MIKLGKFLYVLDKENSKFVSNWQDKESAHWQGI